MEQIKELLNILKETPEMALWGIGMYFIFILLKMASWVTALTVVAKLAINKYFNDREKSLEVESKRIELIEKDKLEIQREELKQSEANRVLSYFDKKTTFSVSKDKLFDLINVVKNGDYIHQTDIDNAIKAIIENKDK